MTTAENGVFIIVSEMVTLASLQKKCVLIKQSLSAPKKANATPSRGKRQEYVQGEQKQVSTLEAKSFPTREECAFINYSFEHLVRDKLMGDCSPSE